MKSMGERIVEKAREWRNTPWKHQARIKGQAVDCAGLIFAVNAEVKTGIPLDSSEVINTLAKELQIPDNYRRQENGVLLLALLEKYMVNVPKEDMAPGDVVALIHESLREPTIPRHLGIVTQVTPQPYIIHASGSKHGVVEHRMDKRFLARVHSCWRLQE